MNSIEEILHKSDEIERLLNYRFINRELLILPFIHRSFFNEHRDLVNAHNERLEFLGDSVLGALISEYLYEHLPAHPEGELSQLRSFIVEANACVSYVQKLNVAPFILLGKGEKMNDGRGRETILADLFEAIIGAIYLDGGLKAAKDFFFHHFLEELQKIIKTPLRNWKTELQDYSQKRYQKHPTYKIIQESGPDHDKIFVVSAWIGDQELGQGKGSSKKQAEIAAAEAALSKLQING